ncbi:MAG: lysylphosphatidylglycerol synthase transmembrane domain-containing protein [Desulfovibrionaceae bacterium]
MRKWLSLALRAVLVAGCAAYVAWDLDWAAFGNALLRYDPMLLAAALAMTFPPYVVQGYRLRYLTRHAATFSNCFAAALFCLGVNNILPAKLGEVAKAFYLRHTAGIPLGQGLGMVFWERFFDLNTLLLFGMCSAWGMGYTIAVAPLGAVVGGIWACLVMFRLFPATAAAMERLIPGERLRLLFREVMTQVRESSGWGFFVVLGLYSVVFWAANVLFIYAAVQWVGGAPLTMAQAVTVLVMSGVGMAVPSSPGSLGVFEAAVLLSLSWFGIPKAEALGIGLVLRVLTFTPTTLAALVIMARSGLSLKGIRASDPETL